MSGGTFGFGGFGCVGCFGGLDGAALSADFGEAFAVFFSFLPNIAIGGAVLLVSNEFVHVDVCYFVVALDDPSAKFRHDSCNSTIRNNIGNFYLADV